MKKPSASLRTPRALEALAPVNYFFALFANALYIADNVNRRAHIDDNVFGWIFEIQPFPWPELIAHHFVDRGKKKQTTGIRTSVDERLACVNAIHEYFEKLPPNDSENGNVDRQKIDICVGAVRVVVLGGNPATRSPYSKNPLSSIVAAASEVLDPSERNGTKLARLRKIDKIIQELLVELVKDSALPPYLVKKLYRLALRLSSPISLNDLYDNTIFGPYYIIRKARSAMTDARRDRDVIVRDLLWIRPLTHTPDETGCRVANPGAPTEALGYYVSAMDNQVFEINSIAMRGNFIMIEAIAYLDGTETKSTFLYLPKLPMQATRRVAFTSILGSLRDQERTGAWSALVARPDISSSDMLRLHYAFIFFSDIFSFEHFETKRDNYDPLIAKVHTALATAEHCGVIFSQDWMDRAGKAFNGEANGVHIRELERRRNAFEACFDFSEKHDVALEEFVDRLMNDPAFSGDEGGKVSRDAVRQLLIDIFKRAEQTAINPISVRNPDEAFLYLANPEEIPALEYLVDP